VISPQDFVQLFRDEADLREKIAALFRKMPRTQGVQITHGAQELGKDLIFYTEDAIGDWRLTACVVKNDQINGQADSNRGARTAFTQAEQALDSPWAGADGADEFVSNVYIISPYDCPASTMASIRGKLAQRRGQVSFLCGSKLADLFEEHLPELLLFDSSFLGTYVLQLQKKLKQMDPIRFLMQHHDLISGGLQSFEAVYVRQSFRKRISRFEVSRYILEEPAFPVTAISYQEITEMTKWLSRLADLVFDAQLWSTGDIAEATALSRRLSKIAGDLATEGQSKITQENRSRASSRTLMSQDEVNQTRIILSEEIRVQVIDARRELKDLLTKFMAQVDTANRFAVRPIKSLSDLGTAEYQIVCRVEEVVNANPSVFRRSSDQAVWNLPADILDQTNAPLLITASAGHGKTSFCKWRVLEDIRKLESRESTVIPFYVPLHQHATSILEGCEETFLQDPKLIELLIQLHREGRSMRIFLDGLDEVTTIDQQERLMRQAERLHQKYENLQIVVTARDHVRGPWLRWLSRVELAEFDKDQSDELVSKWLIRGSEEYAAFYAQLEKARTLEPLTKVPLLCTLIIAVFKRSNALPATRSSLYEVFVELMCGGWDLAKNVRRKLRFGVTQKKNVLTRLAGILQLNKKREATEHEFKIAVGEVEVGSAGIWRSMLDEILEDSLVGRVGENIVFSHLSFQEYLAAVDLTDPTGRRQLQALRSYIEGSDWWSEVLSFYLSNSSRPDEMADWITKTFGKSKKIARDRELRRVFLMDAIKSASQGWIPRNQQLSLGYGRDFEST
jgi:hypothetical protein